MDSGQTIFDAQAFLQRYGIAPSAARIAIAEDLYTYRQHATAEAIFERVNRQDNTFSRATVYNTLNLLAEKGAVRSLNIDGKYTRYDFTTDFHAHFRCKACGCIEDVEVTQVPLLALPEGAIIETEEYYISGLCRRCKEKIIKQ